jgi:hypothetical protein
VAGRRLRNESGGESIRDRFRGSCREDGMDDDANEQNTTHEKQIPSSTLSAIPSRWIKEEYSEGYSADLPSHGGDIFRQSYMRLNWIGPFAAACAFAADPPPLEPQVSGMLPRGLMRGSDIVMNLRGSNLQNLRGAAVSGRGITAEVLESSAYRARIRIRADASSEPGRHDLRLLAPQGSTLTWLDISAHPETAEKEPNGDFDNASPLVFPALVNGIITAGDYDYYRFAASAGQTLTFDLLATRNGSPLDGVLELLDARGRTIEFSDDYYAFKDPHLTHRFVEAGDYYLRICGTGESGSENADYRLIAGAMPHADLALPGGGRRGATVEFDLQGVNLDGIREVTLGAGLAKGKVVNAAFGRTRISMAIPADAPLGASALHIGGATLPVPFVVSAMREVTVAAGAARKRQDPLPVELNTVANGVIDVARAADHFTFRVDHPEDVVLSVESMNLGFLLDPLVTVYDEAGKRIAWQDEPTTNTGKEPANLDPHLALRLPAAGRYTVAIRDSQFRGDATFLYRLTLKNAEPDFAVRIVGAHTTLYRGKPNVVNVRVRRMEGWNTPVEVWAEGLPTGVTAPRLIAEPKNTSYTGTCGEIHYLDGTNVAVPVTVSMDAALDVSKIVFRARGVMNGRTVEREARARYWKSRIKVTGDAVETPLFATVADLPGLVFQTPVRAGMEKTTVILTRLDGGAEALTIEGDGVEPIVVPSGLTRVEVRFTKPGEIVLNGSVGTRLLGRSQPIRVESRK